MQRLDHLTMGQMLPGWLTPYFNQQVDVLSEHISQLDEQQSTGALMAAMTQCLTDGYGMTLSTARVLCDLTVSLITSGRPERLRARDILPRIALQRALLAAGIGGQLRPYLEAAAGGALDGGMLDSDAVLDPLRPGERRPNIPSLPPVHKQDTKLDDAGHSPLFQERWA